VKKSGQIILFQFPQTDLAQGKLRPGLLLGKLPGPYDDWLVCMISSQLHQQIKNFDEVVDKNLPFDNKSMTKADLVRDEPPSRCRELVTSPAS
jgi:mRNA interferase MazF